MQDNPFLKAQQQATQQQAIQQQAIQAQENNTINTQTIPQDKEVPTHTVEPVNNPIPSNQNTAPFDTNSIQNNNVPMQVNSSVPIQMNSKVSDSGVMDISMDDDIKISRLERFPKLNKDEVARIAFILFDPNKNNAPVLKMAQSFFHKASSTSFLAPRNKEVLAKVVEQLGEPSKRFGAIILKYSTDQFGNIPQNWTAELFAFIFSTDKFPSLKQIHREWGLMDHDILLQCSDLKFQKFTMQPTREALWRTLPPEIMQDIVDKARELHDKYLAKQLGKVMSDQEILITLGLIQPPSFQQPGNAVFNPFMNNAAGAVPQSGMAPNNSPAANLANQVGAGVPQSGDFTHLLKR